MTDLNLKKLIICADDFGISPGVNRAILNLINSRKLNATSCMTCMPHWLDDFPKLIPYVNQIQLGLHLTLTDQNCMTTMPNLAPERQLPTTIKLLRLAISNSLNYNEILSELQKQYDAFCSAVGKPPDFVDGHHHVHQFPIIRNAVIELLKKNKISKFPWIRICWEPPLRLFPRRESIGKALSIGFFGIALKRLAIDHGIPYNNGFTGVYDYRRKLMSKNLMERLLYRAVDGTVLFCHPGFSDTELSNVDKLTDAREIEYEFFQSSEFQNILTHYGFSLF